MYEILRKLGKHTGIFAFNNMLNKAIGFFLIPLYTRYLTPGDYGILELLSVTIGMLDIFIILGVGAAFFKAYCHDYQTQEDRKEVVSTAFYFLLMTSLLSFGVLSFFSRQLSSGILKTPNLAHLFNIIFITTFFSVNYLVPRSVLRARLESVKYSVIHIVEFTLSICLNIYFIVFRKMGLVGILYSGLISSFIGFLLSLPVVARELKWSFSLKKLGEMLSYGVPLVPSSLALWILTMSDRYFLQHFSNPHELGLYSLGFKFASIFQVLIITPFLLTWPSIYFPLAKRENAPEAFAKIFTYFLLFCLFAVLGLSFFIEPVIKIMSAPEFHGACTVVPIMVLTIVLSGLFRHLDIGFNIRNKTKFVSIFLGVAALLNLGLNYLLVPRYGMMGAAVGTFLSHLCMCLLSYLANRLYYPIPYELFRIAKIVLVFFTLYVVHRVVGLPSTVLRVAVDIVLIMAFPVVLYLIRFYTPEEIMKVRDIVKRKSYLLKMESIFT